MGFYIQDEYWEAVKELPAKDQDSFIGSLTRLFFEGIDAPPKSKSTKALYTITKSRVLCARNKSLAHKPKEDFPTDFPKENTEENEEKNSGTSESVSEDSLKKSESESESKSEKGKREVSRFSAPTPLEVSDYAESIGRKIDAERFCDFYESKGWMVGKSKMKDWRAAVRNWTRNDAPKEAKNDYSMYD